MSFLNSPGVYDRIVDRSFVVNAGGIVAGAIVINSKRGPVGPTAITSSRDFITRYGIPEPDMPSMYSALRYLNRGGILYVNRVVAYDDSPASGMLGDGCSTNYMTFTAENPGSWGNQVSVRFSKHPTQGEPWYMVSVIEKGEEVERFEVTTQTGYKNGYGENVYIEDVINTRSRMVRVEAGPDIGGSIPPDSTAFLNSGFDSSVAPTEGELILGYQEFENTNEISVSFIINAGWASLGVHNAIIEVATARKDAVALLDIPQSANTSVEDIITYRDDLGANSYFAGLYAGWVRVYDPYNDREVEIPPSADIAAIFARTFETAERWDAPAGLQRGVIPNALGVTKVFTEGERDLLYTAGINPVTTYAGTAAVVWGQKTLQRQASAMDRFNVVNLVLWLNTRFVEALQPFVFEPNTSFTRDSVNYLLSNFLENIRVRGGLYDFSVDTSEEINTPVVIDNNQMLVDVYVQPTRTAEFIRVSTIVTPTGVTLA